MSNVLLFPSLAAIIAPSMVDPPETDKSLVELERVQTILELEHEIADLRDALATQSLTLMSYRKHHFTRAAEKATLRRATQRSAVIGIAACAVAIGWKVDFPLAHALITQASAAVGR